MNHQLAGIFLPPRFSCQRLFSQYFRQLRARLRLALHCARMLAEWQTARFRRYCTAFSFW